MPSIQKRSLPVDDIVPLWQRIVEPEMYKMQDDITEEMDAYIDYFHDTFIGKNLRNGRRGRPLFAYALWNKYQDFIDEVPATNNRVEAWNSAWNKSQQSSASLWTVIDGFKREDGLARQKWVDGFQQSLGWLMPTTTGRVSVKLSSSTKGSRMCACSTPTNRTNSCIWTRLSASWSCKYMMENNIYINNYN